MIDGNTLERLQLALERTVKRLELDPGNGCLAVDKAYFERRIAYIENTANVERGFNKELANSFWRD